MGKVWNAKNKGECVSVHDLGHLHSVLVCVRICSCVCVYVCMFYLVYLRVCVCVCVHAYIYWCVFVPMVCLHALVFVYVWVCEYECFRLRMPLCAGVCVFVPAVCGSVVYMHAYIFWCSVCMYFCQQCVSIRLSMWVCVSLHVSVRAGE